MVICTFRGLCFLLKAMNMRKVIRSSLISTLFEMQGNFPKCWHTWTIKEKKWYIFWQGKRKFLSSIFDLVIECPAHCSKSSFFVQKFNLSIFFWVKNSWKCCGFGLFSCWQLWFHEKNCQKKKTWWKTRENVGSFVNIDLNWFFEQCAFIFVYVF